MNQITSLSVCGPTYGIGHTSRQQALLGVAKLEGWEISEQIVNELDEVPPQLSTICESSVNTTCLIIDLDPRFTEMHSSQLNKFLGDARLQNVRKILIDGEANFRTKRLLNKIKFDLSIFPYGNLGVVKDGDELSGFGYSIFSRNLQNVRLTKTYSIGEQQNVIISCGGSDPLDVSSLYLECLAKIVDLNLHIKVVVGKFFTKAQIEKLLHLARENPHKVDFLVNPTSLDDAFAFADLSFVTGGLTRNESMYSGVCTVVADINLNQFQSTQLFSLRSAVLSLGLLGSGITDKEEASTLELISSIVANKASQRLLIQNAKLCFPENGASQVLAEIGEVCLN